MTLDTLRKAASRIADHAAAHGLRSVRVVIHGGEPLLVGVSTLDTMLDILRSAIEPVTSLELLMQTNGVLLSEAFCDVLIRHRVRVGVSLDGDRAANDRHRRHANGASSYDEVLRALELLRRPAYRRSYSGILCTIDVRNDPIRVYEAVVAQQPPSLDFLLPHATWDEPPLRPQGQATPYAAWLRQIYDRWLRDGQPVRVRMFESLLSSAQGGPSGTEQFGLDPADLVVIETDGEWEQADSLKTAFDGAPATGLSVFSHSVDSVAALPEIARRQGGLEQLNATCRSCPVVNQCGGGLFAHRYQTGSDFDNPSVYCPDLKEFIQGMGETQVADAGSDETGLPADLIDQIGAGFGDEATIGHLVDSQFLITRGLVAAVGKSLGGHPYAGAGWDLLRQVDHLAPHATQQVLLHPYVRAWAVKCLDQSRDDDVAYLCSIAAAAAAHAGMQASLKVPARAGRVHLPTLGTLFTTADAVEVSVGPQGVQAADCTWQPVRRVECDGLSVLLEDGDPYRDCHRWDPVDRLTDADEQQWRDVLTAAWQQIREEVPGYVTGLRMGLRVISPLQVDPAGMKHAATARDAFGAVGAAITSPEAIAVMLVHEFQHGKLGALLDLCELYDPDTKIKLRVGWRPDPRPVEGVLQGVYAHIAVADVWRAHAVRPGPQQRQAEDNFRLYRDMSVAALDELMGCGALTPPGKRFADQMAAALERLPS